MYVLDEFNIFRVLGCVFIQNSIKKDILWDVF